MMLIVLTPWGGGSAVVIRVCQCTRMDSERPVWAPFEAHVMCTASGPQQAK